MEEIMAFVKLRVSLDVHVKLHTFAILSIILSFSLDISLPFLFSFFIIFLSLALFPTLSLCMKISLCQFYGHTHADEFELFYDSDMRYRTTNIAYIGPSVTPYYGLNPTYRIYKIRNIL